MLISKFEICLYVRIMAGLTNRQVNCVSLAIMIDLRMLVESLAVLCLSVFGTLCDTRIQSHTPEAVGKSAILHSRVIKLLV